jgi:hypothetical protein
MYLLKLGLVIIIMKENFGLPINKMEKYSEHGNSVLKPNHWNAKIKSDNGNTLLQITMDICIYMNMITNVILDNPCLLYFY